VGGVTVTARKTITVHAVQRADQEDARPLRWFLSRASAEAHRQGAEEEARQRRNPFVSAVSRGDLADFSSLSPTAFRRRLERSRIECPFLDENDLDESASLSGWWARFAGEWSAEQKAVIWDACDRVHFFTVVSATVEIED
jgi:hypothetical protein